MLVSHAFGSLNCIIVARSSGSRTARMSPSSCNAKTRARSRGHRCTAECTRRVSLRRSRRSVLAGQWSTSAVLSVRTSAPSPRSATRPSRPEPSNARPPSRRPRKQRRRRRRRRRRLRRARMYPQDLKCRSSRWRVARAVVDRVHFICPVRFSISMPHPHVPCYRYVYEATTACITMDRNVRFRKLIWSPIQLALLCTALSIINCVNDEGYPWAWSLVDSAMFFSSLFVSDISLNTNCSPVLPWSRIYQLAAYYTMRNAKRLCVINIILLFVLFSSQYHEQYMHRIESSDSTSVYALTVQRRRRSRWSAFETAKKCTWSLGDYWNASLRH